MAYSNQSSAEMQTCINDCYDCHSTCLETIAYCVQKGGKYTQGSHFSLLQDCAEICLVNGNLILRHSALQEQLGEACVRICEACAEECDGFSDDLLMKACAMACLHCAESCLIIARAHI
jgi:hypothetical protein